MKRRVVDAFHRIANPIARRVPRRTPVGGRVVSQMTWVNKTANTKLGTELLTIRVDLDA